MMELTSEAVMPCATVLSSFVHPTDKKITVKKRTERAMIGFFLIVG
jgi:hypothetical protein